MRGTFVAVGMLPTPPQSVLNISPVRYVEAPPGLLAERAVRDHRLDPGGHRAPRSSGRSPPTRRARRSRAARAGPSGGRRPARMQSSIACGSSPLSSSSATASNRNGNSSRLTTKPGVSGHLDRGLAERGAERARARARLVVGLRREHELDQVHLRDRVEHVQADEALGPAGLRRERGDRQRRRRRGQDRAVRRAAAELGAAAPPWRPAPRRSPRRRTSRRAARRGRSRPIRCPRPRRRASRSASRPWRWRRPGGAPTARPGRARPRRMRARRRWRRRRRSRSVLTRCRSPWLTGQSTPYTTQPSAEEAEVHREMESGREVVIVEAVRTPIGRGHPEKGYYKDTHPNELLGDAASPR